MRELRTCESSQLFTGTSKCPPNFGKMRVVILVKPGVKLPAKLKGEDLEEMIHADVPNRAYGITGLCEYAKNGGEVQTGANGYGPEQVTGVSARKDTFDLERFSPELDASLMQASNSEWDAYFIDDEGYLHGINDGTETLAGYPMSSVYGESTPIGTSSSKATMQVVLCHKDAKLSKVKYDYEKINFNYSKLVLGILAVKLEKFGETGSKYKLYEAVGGHDITSIYGPLIAEAGATIFEEATTATTYNKADQTLTITASDGVVVRLKSASALYEKGIKGIEQI